MSKAEIKEALKEALEEHHTDFYVEAEKHYQDHQQLDQCRESKEEWQANHKLISDIRKSGEQVRGVIWTTLTRSLVVALLGLLVYITTAFWQGRIKPPVL